MKGWRKCLLGDIITFQRGYDLPKSKMVPGKYPVIGSNGVIGFHNEYTTEAPSITIGRSGNTGNPFIVYGRSWSHNTTLYVKEFKGSDPIFIYYLLKHLNLGSFSGGSAVPTLNRNHIHTLEVFVPPLVEQIKIGRILRIIDDKIATNNAINQHLEQIAKAIFRSWFEDFEPFSGQMPKSWTTSKAEDFFAITIGRTPPRKEAKWFSTNPEDVVWVSIADMGKCGVFISGSSEYLTREAVSAFNIQIVPSGTVLVSFKLTIGRVTIADGEMATNEAIAHFRYQNKSLREYLYCYLKAFDYQSLGNTSSIATAVNSKTIKTMPFVMPDDETVEQFHSITEPLFEKIRSNLRENTHLAAIRDALLPRLMSGELSAPALENIT